jgi:hypothetical protein
MAYVCSGLGGFYYLLGHTVTYLLALLKDEEISLLLLVHIDSICLGHTSAISLIREQMLGLVCEIVLVQYHTKVSYVLRQLISKVLYVKCHICWSRRLISWSYIR